MSTNVDLSLKTVTLVLKKGSYWHSVETWEQTSLKFLSTVSLWEPLYSTHFVFVLFTVLMSFLPKTVNFVPSPKWASEPKPESQWNRTVHKKQRKLLLLLIRIFTFWLSSWNVHHSFYRLFAVWTSQSQTCLESVYSLIWSFLSLRLKALETEFFHSLVGFLT